MTAAASREAATSPAAGTSLSRRLAEPVDASLLAFFRIGLGSIVVWEVWRFFDHDWIRRYFVDPDVFFTYLGFGWVRPWPAAGMTAHFLVLAASGALVAAGLFFRPAAVVMAASIAYVFLLDKTRYLNHLYLMILLAGVLAILPAARGASVAAWLASRRTSSRAPAAALVPVWTVWLLRFQVGTPYVFAAVAKLNRDWLVHAEPLRAWLRARDDFPLVGSLFWREDVVYGMAWGSVVLDGLGPFLLLHRRTRVPAYAAMVVFHLLNARLFDIGVFPWMMIVATAVFFPPEFPRRMARSIRGMDDRGFPAAVAGFAAGAVAGAFVPDTVSVVRALIGGTGGAILAWHAACDWLGAAAPHDLERPSPRPGPVGRALALALAAWACLLIVVPLRHYAIPGHVSWTEEGHRFAWHMKLRDKDADEPRFRVTDPATGMTRTIEAGDYLTGRQTGKMSTRPDMILQFAHFLERRLAAPGQDLEVRADVHASLNGRPRQRLVAPDVDLTRVSRWDRPPASWIVPMRPADPGSSEVSGQGASE